MYKKLLARKIEVNIHLYLAAQKYALFLRICDYNKLAKIGMII